MPMPASSPNTTTPAKEAATSTASRRRNAAMRRISGTSMRRSRHRPPVRRAQRAGTTPAPPRRTAGRARRRSGHHARQLAPTPGGIGERGAAARRRHREAASHARRDVGARQSQQLLVGVDPVSGSGREGAGREDVVGEDDDADAGCRGEHAGPEVRRQSGERQSAGLWGHRRSSARPGPRGRTPRSRTVPRARRATAPGPVRTAAARTAPRRRMDPTRSGASSGHRSPRCVDSPRQVSRCERRCR